MLKSNDSNSKRGGGSSRSESSGIFDNKRYASRDRLFSNSAQKDNFKRDLGKIIQKEGLGYGSSQTKAKWIVDDMDKQFGGLTKRGPSGGVNKDEMKRYFDKLKVRNDGLSPDYVEKLKNVFLGNHKNN